MADNSSRLVNTTYDFPFRTTRSNAAFGKFTVARVITPYCSGFTARSKGREVNEQQDKRWFEASIQELDDEDGPADHDLGLHEGEPLRCARRATPQTTPSASASLPPIPSAQSPSPSASATVRPTPPSPVAKVKLSASQKRSRAGSASSVVSASLRSPPRKLARRSPVAPVNPDVPAQEFTRLQRRNFKKRQQTKARNISLGVWTVAPPKVKPHNKKRTKDAQLKAIKAFLHDSHNAPVTTSGWIGLVKRLPEILLNLEQTLKLGGLQLFEWDGIETIPIVDAESRIVALLGGRPSEAGRHRRLYTDALRDFVELLRRINKLLPYHAHRRGPCKERTMGTSFGGGQVQPGPLRVRPSEVEALRSLLEHEGHQRIAGWADSLFRSFQPRIHEHGMERLRSLAAAVPGAGYPWPGAFPDGFWAGATTNWTPDGHPNVPTGDIDDDEFDDSELDLSDNELGDILNDANGGDNNAHMHHGHPQAPAHDGQAPGNNNADGQAQENNNNQQAEASGSSNDNGPRGRAQTPENNERQRTRCTSSTRRERRWRRQHPGVCWPHTDQGNLAWAWCAITALGNFDPDRGGHLILWDLGLVIRFPPLSTILIQSATITHSNVNTAPGDERFSNVLFSAGGLFRYAENGNMTDKVWRRTVYNRMSRAQKQEWWASRKSRWEDALEMMTKVDLEENN